MEQEEKCEFHPWSTSTVRRVSVNGVLCIVDMCDECFEHGTPAETRVDNAGEEDGYDPDDIAEFEAERRM